MWKRWIAVLLVAALGILPQGKALASSPDPWAIAAQALGIYGMYKSALTDLLRMGNNVHAQVSSRRQDLRENGQDRNPMDVQLVERVMKQLIDKGDYAMQVNSLPFLWAVNDSKLFNASCYPTNYISVNRGLVRGLNSDEDEIAAVLAHEMVHGLRQHSAHNYAQAVAQAKQQVMEMAQPEPSKPTSVTLPSSIFRSSSKLSPQLALKPSKWWVGQSRAPWWWGF